jgi:hypothetical protein
LVEEGWGWVKGRRVVEEEVGVAEEAVVVFMAVAVAAAVVVVECSQLSQHSLLGEQ